MFVVTRTVAVIVHCMPMEMQSETDRQDLQKETGFLETNE